ncbi:hypothetical protein T492DRAFT_848657 [Pavlovales sp. CCMP2436]|nr:hypothetical protein T492DRAFT_848657 [Pavlovales sp. CCMP2436]
MAWSGLTAMGYAMNLVTMDELLFAIIVAAMQIAFNAFVLGTLFHYLVRTDENTASFKELLKALEQGKPFHVPFTSILIRNLLIHQKQTLRQHDTIFSQMPLTLKMPVTLKILSKILLALKRPS